MSQAITQQVSSISRQILEEREAYRALQEQVRILREECDIARLSGDCAKTAEGAAEDGQR